MTGVFFKSTDQMSRFKGIFNRAGIFSQIVILLFLVLFFTLCIVTIVGIFPHPPVEHFRWVKITQLLLSVFMWVLPSFAFAYLSSEVGFDSLHFHSDIDAKALTGLALTMILIIPFINLLSNLNQQVVLPKALSWVEKIMKEYEQEAEQLTAQFLDIHSIRALLFNLTFIALVPAFGEELFFRGTLQRIFANHKSATTSIWLTAIIFSAIHFQFYGFVPRMLLGAFFGYLFVWSGNLWIPIAAHFTNNAVAVIFYYLKNNGYKLPDIDTVGSVNTWWIGVLSGIAGILGVYFLYYRYQKHTRLQ
jgi:membrane protease YdiL (CAAX protease family)